MIRDPHDLQRYTASERANHWITGICFILLALSGLSLFHPALFPLTLLFGGGTWTRILHPFIGVAMMLFFVVMFFRFKSLNHMTPTDWEWVRRAKEMVDGDDHNMPEMGKYNGGQKLLFWFLGVAMLVLFVSGIVIWRAYFSASFPIGVVRLGAAPSGAGRPGLFTLTSRKTTMKRTYQPSKVRRALNDDQFRLYSLIWERFIACQMVPAQWDSTSVRISGENVAENSMVCR